MFLGRVLFLRPQASSEAGCGLDSALLKTRGGSGVTQPPLDTSRKTEYAAKYLVIRLRVPQLLRARVCSWFVFWNSFFFVP